MSALKNLENKEELNDLELAIWWVQDDGTKEAIALAESAAEYLARLESALAAKDERERMAIILLECCKPHVEAMVGIASSARGVPEMIDMYIDGTLKFDDESAAVSEEAG